ncbi:MFS general substrate transporter [Clavulina sp. PMI_390]|nr:MFS general substrate transporter [Clavulina sp. PMI_390]
MSALEDHISMERLSTSSTVKLPEEAAHTLPVRSPAPSIIPTTSTPADPTSLTPSSTHNASPVSVGENVGMGVGSSLPPMDQGRRAWTFVFCSFVLESLIWGFPFSFGVFQQYYLTTPPFNTASEQTINAIGNIAIGLQYLEMPIVIAILQRRPQWIRPISWSALAASSLGLFLSSFAQEAWQLVALQGVVVGVSGGILYAPIVIWLGQWFMQRRALAGSLIFGGSGIGGAFFPLIIQFLLDRTGGFRWTLRILAIAVAVCGGTAMLGIKPRAPISRVSNPAAGIPVPSGHSLDLSFFKSPIFIVISMTTITQALAYFPVSLYIPSYSTAAGLSTVDGTIALAVFNLARVVGQVIFGEVCDRVAYTNVIIFSGAVSALSAFLVWGFSHNLGSLFAFVIVFGAICGGFSSISVPASVDIAGSGAQSSMVYGCFGMCKGGAVIIGPMIAASLHARGRAQTSSLAKPAYGGYGFTFVELFVGSMMVLTTAGGIVTVYLRGHRVR